MIGLEADPKLLPLAFPDGTGTHGLGYAKGPSGRPDSPMAAAWDAASAGPTSTAICSTSWYRIAAASTVTSHHCHLLYSTLAERTVAAVHEASDALGRLATANLEQASETRSQLADGHIVNRSLATTVGRAGQR